jgi:hypothetical protein
MRSTRARRKNRINTHKIQRTATTSFENLVFKKSYEYGNSFIVTFVSGPQYSRIELKLGVLAALAGACLFLK